MGIKKSKLLGCAGSLMIFLGCLALTGIVWLFREPITDYFFDDAALAGLVGLLIVVSLPFILYIAFMLYRSTV